MQTKLAKILIILIICILTMGDVIAIAENLTVMPILERQSEIILNEEEIEVLELKQTLITSKEYKIGDVTKKIIQLSLEVDANNLQTSSLKENQITLTTPIEGVKPEAIYISEQDRANFVNATWEYINGKLLINLENDEIEKNKEEKIDKLILTYVYNESTDVSKVVTKATAEGKLYNGKKAISDETEYEVENTENFGEIIQVTSKIQEIYKTELQKENQEFTEKTQINLSYKNTEMLDRIILSDNLTQAYIEGNALEVTTQYKASLINKQELLSAIGENGTLIIKNEENEILNIDKETETDEAGYIVVNYEEGISKITIEIALEEQTSTIGKVENGKFTIINKREIEKCSQNTNFDKQIKTINVVLEKGKEISKFETQSIGEIKYKLTKAELGVDKQELTATQENELTATITMHAENKRYDLNKNPRYEIVLPKEIEVVKLGSISILNNKDFIIKEAAVVENDNGQKVVVIILDGEQNEYVEEAGSVQIIVPLKVSMSKLIPTTSAGIELYYTNENAESYETTANYGREEAIINIISDADLIVATEARIGEEKTISYKTDIAKISMKKTEEAQTVEIKAIIINNTDSVKENLKLIGENELLSEITANKGNIYYSEIAEGPWADSFSAKQKYFKIEVENLEIGEKLEFTYTMQIPEALKESKNYEATYKVYEGENLSKESKLEIVVEVEEKVEKPAEEIAIRYESSIEKYGGYEIENVEIDSDMIHKIFITNYSETEKNAVMTLSIPQCINKNSINAEIYEKTEEIHPESGKLIYSYLEEVEAKDSDNKWTYNITIPANTEIMVRFEFIVEKYVQKEVKTDIDILAEGQEYKFTNTEIALSPANIEANIVAYVDEKEVKTDDEITLEKGDTIKYITKIVNNGETTENIEVVNRNLTDFKRIKQQIYVNNVLTSEFGETDANIFITERMELKSNDEIKIVLVLELTKEIEEDVIVESYSEIRGYAENLQTEKINLKLLRKEIEEPEQPTTPDEPEQPTTPDEPEKDIYSISGVAWLDKNKNGSREENEDCLKGIEVALLNATTNEKILTTITDTAGEYEFKNLDNGKYLVNFKYNTTTYNLTTYKKQGIDENKNSDAILTSQNGVNIAKTEVIEINNKNITNVDIGFILKEIFDLEVTKQIKKVTIKNNDGQTVYEYKNTDFAKIEISSKSFKGTNLVIEYEVQIENKGDVSGYVKTLTDHKPEGLEFLSELNTSWYEGTDGNLYCIEFSEDEILPGEIRKVALILTKEIPDTKIQYITNEVELEDLFNEYLISEKDVSNNKAEATLIIAIKTGVVRTYLGLWLACVAIIVAGTQIIKKKIM